MTMPRTWEAADLLQMASAYQTSCLLAAAAELELFDKLRGAEFTAGEAATRLGVDHRALRMLLDALCAGDLLEKRQDRYSVPPRVAELLSHDGAGSVLAMIQHQANCMRRWAQLALVVKSGRPAPVSPSIRGEAADYASFIEAMDNVSRPAADPLIARLGLDRLEHLLDVGGASGTWTLAFLRAHPQARATIFDLPHVLPQARQRIEAAGMSGRVVLVGGDYLVDPLPAGADLAWVSAIVHSLSLRQIRRLFSSVATALAPGGRILVRDFVMDESRTKPVAGAMFALNMLSANEGGTYTFGELRAELESAGFEGVDYVHRDDTMNTVLGARKK
jgi:SAM-dependent methyltransferase